MEPYEVLTGGAPTPEQQAALVEALRRRRAMGILGSLTGDRVMAPVGQRMTQQADDYANRVQGIRQADADDKRTQGYYDWQRDSADANRTQQMEIERMRDATTRRGQDLDLKAAQTRAANSNSRGARLRAGDINDLQQGAESLQTLQDMQSYMESGGKLGAIGDVPVVGSILRKSANQAARYGVGSEETKKSALMWQNYRRFYELRERNSLFGATLTPNEMRAWDSANPSALQSDEQIAKGFKIMSEIAERKLRERAEGLEMEGYDPQAIARYGGLDRAMSGEVPPDFDLEAAQQYLMENPDTLPQFQEMLLKMGIDPGPNTPAM